MSTLLRERPPTADVPPEPAASPRPRRRAGLPFLLLHLLNVREGWLAVVGFALAAEAVAGSVRAAYWQPGLTDLPALVAVAMLAGYFSGRELVPRPAGYLLAAAAGAVASVKTVGDGALASNLGLAAQLGAVLARLVDWTGKAVSGQVTEDNLLIALAVAAFLYCWTFLAYRVGVTHGAGWPASAMLGAAILANVQFKAGAASPYLLVWAAGCLILNLRLSLGRKRSFYQRLRFADWRSGERLALAGGLAIAGLVALAFGGVPQVQVNKTLNDLWNRVNGPIGQAQRLYQSFGVPQQLDPSQIRGSGFEPRLRFLGPFHPGVELVMKVRSDRPRYQQGLVYDRYDAGGWTNTRFEQFQNNSSEFATMTAQRETARDRDRRQISEEIIQVRPQGALLFAAPQPLGASVKLKGDGFGDLRATAVIQANQRYTAASLESTATAESLASAAGPVPAGIRAAYLQLPAGLSARVKQLAQRETAGRRSAFDQAEALEAFLRTFAYDTEIPPPPAGRDGVDWFLFDMRRGYCDYTASAMAVMLRELGIPARIVSGFAPGSLDPGDGYYHVTEKDTHTWTQAYFPGYGWIDFEPSAQQPPFPRAHAPRSSSAGGAQSQPTPTLAPSFTPTPGGGAGSSHQPGPGAGSTDRPGSQPGRTFPWLLLLAILAGAGGILYAAARRSAELGARLAYARLALLGTILGLRPHRWQTPREFGRELNARRGLDPVSTDTITGLYSADRYGRQPLGRSDNRRAWSAWERLRDRFVRPWRRG
ncbi:MAG: transglutaminase domain-containing protein [Chloroflexota bacterium]|nr:transglutaminase domain-containing protein [Chloroflexota bacterium]